MWTIEKNTMSYFGKPLFVKIPVGVCTDTQLKYLPESGNLLVQASATVCISLDIQISRVQWIVNKRIESFTTTNKGSTESRNGRMSSPATEMNCSVSE